MPKHNSFNIPLATRLRPQSLTDFIGQTQLLAEGNPLKQAIDSGNIPSMILWGPSGTGKTTLAKIIANRTQSQFLNLSAVMSGVKEIREAVKQSQSFLEAHQLGTILFVDEVHRFNKSQQDAFLPYIEEGVFTFIGATTENPSFELNNALLSRCHVYVLNSLTDQELLQILDRALLFIAESKKLSHIEFELPLREMFVKTADQDARQLLNLLELLFNQVTPVDHIVKIEESFLKKIMTGSLRRFDKGGDNFYDQISALHKAVRGSSPDGALYWYARMLDGGCDPLYIARRVVRMASEDIGNADPKALQIAMNAWEVQERLGSPEGDLAIAQAIVYMAAAPKSNAVYTAFKAALNDAKTQGSLPVPLHIRNAPTSLMKNLDYGKKYRYDHDEPNAFAKGQTYFPEIIGEKKYYYPAPRGLEIKIKEKLDTLRPD